MSQIKSEYQEENHLLANNIVLSIFLKCASMLVSLVNTKYYITYFNDDIVLGGWFSIVSLLNWILYFDLGIGNGLRNGLVPPMERGETSVIKRYISTGYCVIAAISICVTGILLVVSRFLNWNQLLNLPLERIQPAALLTMITVSSLGLGGQFVLKIIISIYQAMRKTAVSGITALSTNVLIFLYLRFVSFADAESALVSFSLAYAVSTCLPLLLVTLIAFSGKLKAAAPSIKDYNKDLSLSISSLGVHFFVIQVALLIASSTDSWLISYFYSPADAVEYQIYYRLFSIALTVYALFSQTAWSSVTKAYAVNNSNRIKEIQNFLNGIALLGTVCCILLALAFKRIVHVWMGESFSKIELRPALLFAFWMSIQMFNNASTAVANGMGKLKCQTVFIPAAGIIKVVCVLLLNKTGMNWHVVLISNIICLLPLQAAQLIDNKNNMKNMIYESADK